MPADPTIDVSVIFVSYNTADETEAAVASVLDHAGALSVEVIVVDNASPDDSLTRLRGRFGSMPNVAVVDAGYNGGYGWGNNVGIAMARGRHVLVMNPDALMHEGTLAQAVAYLEDHPEVGILGARVVHENGDQQSTLFRALRLRHLMWRVVIPNRVIRETTAFGDQRYADLDRSAMQDVEVVAGCFMMLRREVIEDVGAMDPRFFMYSEESEWCWRVADAGYRIRYLPEIEITHHGAVSTGQSSPWKALQIAKGHVLFLRFTRGAFVAWLGTLIMVIGELLRAFVVLPLGVLRRRKDEIALWRARMVFLLKALVVPPRGAMPPPPEPQKPAPAAVGGLA